MSHHDANYFVFHLLILCDILSFDLVLVVDFLSQLLFIYFFIISFFIIFPYYYYYLLYFLSLAKIKHIYSFGFMIYILTLRHYHPVGFSIGGLSHHCSDVIPFSLIFQPTQLAEVGAFFS
jgi:hypothetical protein